MARTGYADPTAGRDLLGSRSLCFIFICAFALVTLVQQILYGKNYVKRYKHLQHLSVSSYQHIALYLSFCLCLRNSLAARFTSVLF